MGNSSILGADRAPTYPAGRDSGALGPSDSSDSGSDMDRIAPEADTDRQATGERASVAADDTAREGADISPDRITGVRNAGEQAEDDEWLPEDRAPREPDTTEELDFDDDPIEGADPQVHG